MTSTLDTVAREMASEANCIGLSSINWENSAEERKDAWRMIAAAGILALRDEVGKTVVDRILAPEKAG